MLVFKGAIARKAAVKAADFGYSTLTAGESGKVLLPKPRPWNAPERHSREFKAHEVKKTDVYSFGVCMSVIFYLAACGPKGHGSGLPLPSRTAALFKHPHYMTVSCPQPLRVIPGQPFLLNP